MKAKTSTTTNTNKRMEKPGISNSQTARRAGKKHATLPTPGSLDYVLERVNDGFVAFDADMNYAYINPRGAELLGRKPGDLIGKNYWKEYPEAEGTPFANAYVRALETQKSIQLEDFYEPFDRWFENRIYPSKDGLSIFFTDITERKRIEDALHRSQQILQLFVERAPAAIAMFDLDMNYLAASHRYLVDYELGNQNIIGRSHYELFPEIPDRWREIHRHCLSGATERCEEDPFPRASGKLDWVRWEICPWYESNGRIGGIILFSEVITGRKQSEEARRKSEERYRRLAEEFPNGTVNTYDRDLHITYVGGTDMKKFGVTEEMFIGKSLYEIAPPETISVAEPNFRKAFQGETVQYDARYNDGRAFEVVAAPLYEEDGSIEEILVISQNVSERKQVEKALRKAEENYRSIFENAPVGIFQSTPQGRYITVNASMARIYGYESAEEMIERITEIQTQIYVDPSRRDEFKKQLESHEVVERFEDQNYRKDGSIFWTSTNARTVYDAERNVMYYEGFVVDIMEQRKVEQALRDSEDRFSAFMEHLPAAAFIKDRESRLLFVNRYMHEQYGSADLIGKLLYEYNSMEDAERFRAEDLSTFAEGARVIDETTRDKTGKLRDLVTYKFVIPRPSQQDLLGAISLDITERKMAEEILNKRYAELRAIYDGSQRLQKLLSPELLAQEIIEVLEQTLHYTYGSVLLLDDNGETLSPFAISDQKLGAEFREADKEYIRSKGVKVGTGITGWVAKHGESLRLDDVRQDARYLPLREDVRSELCVPLRIQDRVIGVVNIESTQTAAYSEDDQRLLETVTAQISVALQNARLLNELRQHRDRLAELSRRLVDAHETEQRTIGRELHDQFGQMLTALKLTMDVIPKLPLDLAAKKIAQSQEMVNDLLTRVSRLSLELRPPMLDDLGLIPALNWHVTHYQEQTGIEVDFKHSGVEGKRFDIETETTVYRIVQEAHTNVARHALGSHTRLEVHARGGHVEVRIEDNGKGFDPKAALAKHRGLSSMRERAVLLGGEFLIDSKPGGGTMIFIKLPLREKTS